jgi:hypothetical protein
MIWLDQYFCSKIKWNTTLFYLLPIYHSRSPSCLCRRCIKEITGPTSVIINKTLPVPELNAMSDFLLSRKWRLVTSGRACSVTVTTTSCSGEAFRNVPNTNVTFEVFTAVTMKNAVFWDIKPPVRISQEAYYFSATEPHRLMLCKIWNFHGGDYEECRLLGYNNPVLISQETNYVSYTEPHRLMPCKIWGFHGGDYVTTCGPFRSKVSEEVIDCIFRINNR